jgi:peptidoglycan-associated lipoprotein
MRKTAVVLASVLIAACNSTHKTASSLAPQSSGTTPTPAALASVDLNSLNAELRKLEAQSDYFDFDKFAIKPEFQNVIRKEAEFIKSHKQDFVTLEGNADERGSNKYNMQLGNKRALAVEQTLVALGVPQAQIKVVSQGEEKPRLTCHEEKCWKENRRVDFVHQLN